MRRRPIFKIDLNSASAAQKNDVIRDFIISQLNQAGTTVALETPAISTLDLLGGTTKQRVENALRRIQETACGYMEDVRIKNEDGERSGEAGKRANDNRIVVVKDVRNNAELPFSSCMNDLGEVTVAIPTPFVLNPEWVNVECRTMDIRIATDPDKVNSVPVIAVTINPEITGCNFNKTLTALIGFYKDSGLTLCAKPGFEINLATIQARISKESQGLEVRFEVVEKKKEAMGSRKIPIDFTQN